MAHRATQGRLIGRDPEMAVGNREECTMPTVTTDDGTEISTRTGAPVSRSCSTTGGRLSSDDWDAQLMYFVQRGYRVIAHDRRGHGRSSQVADGHDMDHYAADAAAVVEHLDLHDAVHVGHSTGGGEVARYVARHGSDRVAKAVLIGAVPPLMLQPRALVQPPLRSALVHVAGRVSSRSAMNLRRVGGGMSSCTSPR